MTMGESAIHKLTVSKVTIFESDLTNGGPFAEVGEDLDRAVEHPADCDRLKYGEQCSFDAQFFECSEGPQEPGVYAAWVWSERLAGSGPWGPEEWNSGSQWEPWTAEHQAAWDDQRGSSGDAR